MRTTTQKAFATLMNGLTVVFAYTGFVVGNEDAALFASALIFFGTAVVAIVHVMISALFVIEERMATRGLDGVPQKVLKQRADALAAVTKLSNNLNIWHEAMWDVPVIAFAIFGGAYISAAAYAYQLYGCWFLSKAKHKVAAITNQGDLL